MLLLLLRFHLDSVEHLALRPTGAFTGATGGALAYSADGLTEDIPIGLAFTAVVNRALILVSNGLLVYPNYV
jgi:hypothetical protein